MTLLSILVTITEHLALYTFAGVAINTVQINGNEMPWHSCFNSYSSAECKTQEECPRYLEEDFFDYEKRFVYERGIPPYIL
ncbi:hypothetical protein GCK32_021244, partial [Trichostrongylus colubriformis]